MNNSPGRPHLLTLPHASNVLLENFLMLNAADINAELHGEHYRIFGIRIRGPDYDIAPNTDGIDVHKAVTLSFEVLMCKTAMTRSVSSHRLGMY